MSSKTMGLILMMMPLPAQAQIPPPPPLPGQNVLGENLVRSIEAKDLDSYAKLLSDKLVVYDDGKVVARSKEEWLKAFEEKLVAEGVTFEVSPGFSSTGRLLLIEYFNSAGSWGGSLPAHCCWSYDAVAYDVAEEKVTVIRRLRGGNTKLDERGLPAR